MSMYPSRPRPPTVLRWLRQFGTGSLLVSALAGCSGVTDGPSANEGNATGGALGSAGARSDGASGAGLGGAATGASGGQSPVGMAGAEPNGLGGGGSGGLAGGDGTSGSDTAGSTSGSAGAGGSAGASGAAGANSAGTSGGGGAAGAAGTGALANVSVYIAGDSTVSQYVLDPQNPKSQAGWGQMLGAYFTSKATVLDKAVGGRTARRFVQEGTLDAILKVIKAGDYLLVQFGTNDSNMTATYTLDGVEYPYYAAAATDFKTHLRPYLTGASSKRAIPVLVTPPPRNSAYCGGGRSLANYGEAMIELANAESVAVIDLGAKTHAHLSAICPKPASGAQEKFFKVNADGSIDGTHFQESGARVMAGLVADGIGEAKLGLAGYLKP